MSNNDENNSRSYITNNSAKNVCNISHQKNKSFNLLSDTPSTLITVQIHSSNSNPNSKSKEKSNKSTKNIYNPKNLNIKNNIKESKTEPEQKEEENKVSNQIKNNTNSNCNDSNKNKLKETSNNYTSAKPELEQNSLKDINNFRVKLSKINEQYSSNTPKQLSSAHKVIVESEGDQGNILVKKNLRLGTQRAKNSPEFKDKVNINENKVKNIRNDNKNDYVKYVNNDKFNFNGNILNMTQKNKQSKYILSQSKSFTKVEKKNSVIGLSSPTNNNSNNIDNNSNIKRNQHFNYINYNNYKNNCNKRKELTVLTKTNNTFRNNKIENNNNINSFVCTNVSTSPNANNHVQSFFNNISKINYSKKGGINKTPNNVNRSKNISNGGNRSNNNSNSNIIHNNVNKNIYFMKPTQQRKKNSYGKNHEICIISKDNTTNQSSLRSKGMKENNYKTTLDSSFLGDVFNKNIDNPEELHFFYIKMLQNGKEISKKFEIDNT